jgi:hypothetical protein
VTVRFGTCLVRGIISAINTFGAAPVKHYPVPVCIESGYFLLEDFIKQVVVLILVNDAVRLPL